MHYLTHGVKHHTLPTWTSGWRAMLLHQTPPLELAVDLVLLSNSPCHPAPSRWAGLPHPWPAYSIHVCKVLQVSVYKTGMQRVIMGHGIRWVASPALVDSQHATWAHCCSCGMCAPDARMLADSSAMGGARLTLFLSFLRVTGGLAAAAAAAASRCLDTTTCLLVLPAALKPCGACGLVRWTA